MSDLSEIIESAFCDRVFKGEPDFLASLYRLRDPGSPLDKSGRILASYVRRSSGTDGLSGSVVYRVRCDSSVCYVYFQVRYLQKDGMGRPVHRRFILQSVSDELY